MQMMINPVMYECVKTKADGWKSSTEAKLSYKVLREGILYMLPKEDGHKLVAQGYLKVCKSFEEFTKEFNNDDSIQKG